MQDESAKLETKQIYVPLALVQQTKPDKRSGEFSPEAGACLYEPQYEEKQRFEHQDFLTQILEAGKGKTNGKRIALIGEPGAGKTTLLQHIAFWVSENIGLLRQQETKNVAIWISLADLQGRLLEEYLLQTWLKKALGVVRVIPEMEDALAELFKSERVWLLLDGVDEMTLSDPRQAIASHLTGWVASARVVLACRLNVWQANVNFLEDFETYRLLDFDYPKQVNKFIDNWFKTSDAAKGERLKTELGNTQSLRLRDLVQNPLRLALLCSTWQSREEKLPQTKAGLYQKFVQQFYDWKKYPFYISLQAQQELNNALGRLAKRDIDEGGSRFRLRESFISEELGDWDDENSLFHLALKLGWLNDVGIAVESAAEEKVYAFFHPTFEEYFGALAINDWHFFLNHILGNPKHPNANYRIFEPQWKEVILQWLGRRDVPREQKEEFIQVLVEFDDGCGNFYQYRAYFLAAAGIAEFGDCSRADEIVELIAKWGFSHYSIKKQEGIEFFEKARAILLETERTKAIKTLVEFLHNSHDEYKLMQVAKTLGEIDKGNPTAIKALVDLLQNSQHEYTRLQAARSLGEINKGNPTAINPLVSLLQNSQDEFIRMRTAESLGEIDKGNPTAIEALVSLLQNSQDKFICMRVAESLGNIGSGNPIATEALVELLQNSQDEFIRKLAVGSLGNIGSGNPTAIKTLVSLLQNSHDGFIRKLAVESLRKISSNNLIAIKALVDLLQNSQDEDTCWRAARSLGEIDKDNPIAIKALIDLLQNSQHEDICWRAAESLGKIDKGNPIAIKTLAKLLQNSQDETTRWCAAESLGKIDKGNPTAIEALVDLLQNSQDETTRKRAVRILKEILGKARMAGVVTTLKDYLSNETYENDSERYERCYKVVWHCAQTLPYPTFYQAWQYL